MISGQSGQKGFTLLELLAALSITGVIMLTATGLIFHELRGTAIAKGTVTASYEIGNTALWFSRDAMAAATSTLVDGAAPVDTVTLRWTDWYNIEGTPHQSTYWLSGTELKRAFDGVTSTVARHFSSVAFSQNDRVITLVATTVPDGAGRTVERTLRILLRARE